MFTTFDIYSPVPTELRRKIWYFFAFLSGDKNNVVYQTFQSKLILLYKKKIYKMDLEMNLLLNCHLQPKFARYFWLYHRQVDELRSNPQNQFLIIITYRKSARKICDHSGTRQQCIN